MNNIGNEMNQKEIAIFGQLNVGSTAAISTYD